MAGIGDTDLEPNGENKVPLRCSLCKHVYDVTDRLPKYLPCLHTFCVICLAGHVGRIFQCPGCQQKSTILKRIDGIPTNFAFLNYNQLFCHQNQIKHSNLPTCQSCCRKNQTLKVSHCSDCEAYLCRSCHDNHFHMDFFGTHEVKTIDELKQLSDESLITFFHRKQFCSKREGHTDQRITLFCDHRNCQSLICLQCALLEHNTINHQPINIENAVLKYKKIINGKLDKAIDKRRELSFRINQINQELSNLKANTATQINNVEHFFTELIKQINTRKEQLVREIQKQHDIMETSLNIEKKKLKTRKNIVDTYAKFTEFTLKYDSDVELLTSKYDVCSQLDRVLSHALQDHKSAAKLFPRFFHPHGVNLNMVNNTVFSGHHGKISCDVIETDAVVGKDCNFTITPRNMDGKQLGVSAIPVKVTINDPDNRILATTTDDKGDDTYTVKYRPQRKGKHYVTITIYSTPIEGSPYTINVKPARRIKCEVYAQRCVVNTVCTAIIHSLADIDDMQCLPVLVRDPDSQPVESEITTKHELTFQPAKVGRHEMIVNGNDTPADCNPYIIDVIDMNEQWEVGRTGVNDAEFNIPIGVTVDKKGNVLVADAANKRIQILESNGKYIDQIRVDIPHTSGVAMAPNDNIVVVEWETRHVHIYNENRKKIKHFTYKEFVKPFGITVNSKGHILVADPGASYIFVFTSDGDFIMKIGEDVGEGELYQPAFVVATRNNDVIVSDSKHGLKFFTEGGKYIHGIHQIGDDEKLYDCSGVAVDSDYNIIVADRASTPNRILVLTYDGSVIQSLESQHHKLSRPHGVAVTEDGYVIVADYGNDCIKKYKL
ncbi:E3 ubiquitin-protein ligase TRIM45-like [Saccoglossus kowalevskii]